MKNSLFTGAGWFRLAVLGLAVIACLLPTPLGAQAVSGTILGLVKDTSGAAMPGATVTLVHTDTGLSRTLLTDSKGEYTAPSLPTATYTGSAARTLRLIVRCSITDHDDLLKSSFTLGGRDVSVALADRRCELRLLT